MDNFVAYAVAKENKPLIDALNSGLDAVIADGTWSRLYSDWVPRAAAAGLEAGSKAAPRAAAAGLRRDRRQPPAGATLGFTAPQPKSTLSQLTDSFLDWELYKQAIPDLLKTGLPNTLILTVSASVIGLLLGMVLAVAGISRARWLRWPARVYTDIFRGLPEVVIILLIGLGVGPVVGGLTGNNPYPLGIAALGLMAAAYIGEIFRSGIQSVEAGQLEASRALGFSYASSMRLVVVPQGIRRVLPALVNQFISLLKASLAGVLPRPDRQPARAVPGGPRPQRADRQPVAAGRRRAVLPGADDSADPPGQLHRRPAAQGQTGRTEDPLAPVDPASTQEMI